MSMEYVSTKSYILQVWKIEKIIIEWQSLGDTPRYSAFITGIRSKF